MQRDKLPCCVACRTQDEFKYLVQRFSNLDKIREEATYGASCKTFREEGIITRPPIVFLYFQTEFVSAMSPPRPRLFLYLGCLLLLLLLFVLLLLLTLLLLLLFLLLLVELIFFLLLPPPP